MNTQANSSLVALFESISQLTIEQRHQLQRRLQVNGLLKTNQVTKDRNRLLVAPAIGTQYRQWQNQSQNRPQSKQKQGDPSPSVATPQTSNQLRSSNINHSTSAEYRSPVSGKVVLGTPNEATPKEPYAMQPLPGQAPERPIGIVFDGGSRGNPGRGYGSYAMRWPGQSEQIVQLQFGDKVTNNEAEYDTLIAALEAVTKRLREKGADLKTAKVDIWGDSLLVINQVLNQWRCKEQRMQMRRDQVQSLLDQFGSWQLTHHERAKSVQILGH